jgi:hypothetical protein
MAWVYIVTIAGPTPRLRSGADKAVSLPTHVCEMLAMRADAD